MTRETPSLEPQQAGLLHECRDLAAMRIRRSMGGMLKDLNETLFDRAFGEGGNVADSPYFDAVREIQFRKGEIALRFEKRLTDLFEEELRNARAARDPAAGRPEGTAPAPAGEVADRVEQDCRQALLVLDKRIGVLMRDPNLSCSRNPLAPARVFEAFRAACDDIDSGEQARRLLLDVFERHMEHELGDIYREINSVLARRGVLPGLSILPEQDSGTVTVQLGARGAAWKDEEPAVDSPGPDAAHFRARLEAQLAGRAVPHFVRTFLFERWVTVLQRVAREKGEEGPEWEKAVETAEELIRSVQEFADGNSRRHAIWTLPSLVHRLRRGMRGISMTLHEQMLFLRTLRAYHLRMIGQKTPAVGMRAREQED